MEINTSDCREEKKNSLHFVTLSFLKQETCYTLAGNIPVDKRFEFSPSCIQNVPLISYCMFKCAYISKLNMSFTPAKCHSEAVTLQTLRKKEEKKKTSPAELLPADGYPELWKLQEGKRNVLSSAPSCHKV